MDQLATDDRRIGDVDSPILPPLVSIVITNFNYGRFLETAVQSVEAQSYQRWECVIVDDCSTDGSFELITRYLNSIGDDRFHCQRMDTNSGQLAACLAGLRATSGSFVVFLDADDYLLPDFLETHVRSHLNSAFSAALTASDMLLVDGEGSVIEGTCAWLNKGGLDPAGFVPAAEIPKMIGDARLNYQNTFSLRYIDRHYPHAFAATSSIMFRRAVLELITPEEVEFGRLHADYYFGLFAHLISGTLLISSFHAAYRIHGKNGFGKSLIGGNNSVGMIDESRRIAIERAISHHVIDNYGRLAMRLHPYILKFIAGRYLKKWEILERSRNVPAASANFTSGGEYFHRLKTWYYRYKKK